MSRVTDFSSDFSSDFGHRHTKGYLQLIAQPDHPTYEDGDILSACNHLTIRRMAAWRQCCKRDGKRQVIGRNEHGYMPTTHVLADHHEATYEFKLQRTGRNTATMTRLSDMAELLIETGKPHTDFRGKPDRYMDVALYFARRQASWLKENAQGKIMFTDDGEYPVIYCGRTTAGDAEMDTVWQAIETKVGVTELDETNPTVERAFGVRRNRIVLPVNNFTDAEGGQLTSSLVDETDPENPVTVKKRKNLVDWRERAGLTGGEIDDVNNKKPVQLLDGFKRVRQTMIDAKVLP